jgi:hypothetical protein
MNFPKWKQGGEWVSHLVPGEYKCAEQIPGPKYSQDSFLTFESLEEFCYGTLLQLFYFVQHHNNE